MEPITLLLIGLGAVAVYYMNLGRSAGNLVFYPGSLLSGFSFEDSMPVIYTEVLVQNTSNVAITIYSMAGNVSANDTLVGNLSDFTPVTINPNSEGSIPIKIRFQLLGIVSDIMNAFNTGIRSQTLNVEGSANGNGVQIPVKLTYKLG